ncbi:hypothetical protein CH267_00750 [Rhodococcus sp. 06-621-2]|nr:hypothetical protein [Rhodococcus sp. 06-621-2]OZC62103.1 hypothetical protein CH267_00750 [Rhodococcus sp. 06-621-2]
MTRTEPTNADRSLAARVVSRLIRDPQHRDSLNGSVVCVDGDSTRHMLDVMEAHHSQSVAVYYPSEHCLRTMHLTDGTLTPRPNGTFNTAAIEEQLTRV